MTRLLSFMGTSTKEPLCYLGPAAQGDDAILPNRLYADMGDMLTPNTNVEMFEDWKARMEQQLRALAEAPKVEPTKKHSYC
jgi:hypothetical protein